MHFDVIGPIKARKTIASGPTLRERTRLRKVYGTGHWRKIKGEAKIRLADGTITNAEVHWYEAHGIGKKEMKIKRFVKQS